MSKRYTIEEDAVITDEILMHPGHPGTALRIASDRLGRTYSSVKSRWYNHLSGDTVMTIGDNPEKNECHGGFLRRILRRLGLCR